MRAMRRGTGARGRLAHQTRSSFARELPRCGINTAFKKGKMPTGSRASTKDSEPYDWTRTYRKGQTMTHPTFSFGEVTAVIEPQKIDVLFSDKARPLIHARSQS